MSTSQELPLAGKSAIVTGATRGIGQEIARRLAHLGANVALVYVSSNSSPTALSMVDEFRAKGRQCCAVQADLSAGDCGEVIVREALEGLGVASVEILVNNAGIAQMPAGVEEAWLTRLSRIMHVNVRAPILLVQGYFPIWDLRGIELSICGSSIGSRLNFPGYGIYSASKASLESLTRTWARELGVKYHLTCNAVLVGPTATPDAPDSAARAAAKSLATAEKTLGTPEDVAEVVAWLSGEGSRWVNGDLIGSHGGAFMM
ncbi:NAD(P)-binding protein [Aspergillus ellipticus CBS 707.79]|uniref:NAD(P)-binding protein n=1 Tax=Aspergillus ellipticus CBS 707.79 TaxID=1448320 RepID=A0A319E0G9_9EURO|nr:NAD(P)-binding protein [Aspergillus ellipticus CBS 707.79]